MSRVLVVCWAVAFGSACGGDVTSRRGDTETPPDAGRPDTAVRDAGPPRPLPPPPVPADAGPTAPACGPGEIDCGGRCTDTLRDSENCGSCGVICELGTPCHRGSCESADCVGTVLCGGECADLLNDPNHCGACEHACTGGMFCVGGVCECGDELLDCDGTCVDLWYNNAHCGACGSSCRLGDFCHAGVCYSDCSGLTSCPVGCADLATDPTNCGACGNAVPPGHICAGGTSVCPAGAQECDGECVALADPNHCGACGVVCAGSCPLCGIDLGTATASCRADCPPGERLCPLPAPVAGCGWTCVDTGRDPSHCGGCGNVCPVGTACNAGTCS